MAAPVDITPFDLLAAAGRFTTTPWVDLTHPQWGITALDGSADESAHLQAAIDANKGKTLLIPGNATILAAGILLSGATYNGTTLIIQGEILLKPSTGATNFGGAWVGVILQSCDRVTVYFRGHGNRANQPATEFHYLLGVAGCTNLRIPTCEVREIRGDGIYISQASWTSSSTNSSDVWIGSLIAENTADDGRNALSVISCDNLHIDTLRSTRVGGTIGGVVMPGGLDIEPDQTYQSCTNITVDVLTVTTAGTSGLAVQGQGTVGQTTSGVSIAHARIINTAAATLTDELGATTRTPNHVCVVLKAKDVRISGAGKFTNAYGDGVIVSSADQVTLDFKVRHVTENRIGAEAGDLGVTNSDIRLTVDDIGRHGTRTGTLTDCRISGRLTTPQSAYYTSRFGVAAMFASGVQTRVQYAVDVPGHANWTESYRTDATLPVTYTNTVIRDCDCSGTAWGSVAAQVGDMAVPRLNVRGVTNGIAAPTQGTWARGTFIANDTVAAAGTLGWVCVTAGTPGTWKAVTGVAA